MNDSTKRKGRAFHEAGHVVVGILNGKRLRSVEMEFKHKDGVMMRVEYRGDFANTPYFLNDTTTLKKNQQAVMVGWVYAFSSKTP